MCHSLIVSTGVLITIWTTGEIVFGDVMDDEVMNSIQNELAQ